jgi:dihydrofolate reductase
MALLSLVVAVANNGAIGLNGRTVFQEPDDMLRFRQVTTGHYGEKDLGVITHKAPTTG